MNQDDVRVTGDAFSTRTPKAKFFQMMLSVEDHRTIKTAAAAAGVSMNEFILQTVMKAIEGHRVN